LSRLDRDLKLLAVAILLFAFAIGLYLRLLSTYALALGASGFAIGVLNATMLMAASLCSAPGAWAARRFRLKPVIVGVWWLAGLAPLFYFLAPSWPWLIPGYVVSGLSFANNPAMKSYINLKSEPAHAAGNFAILYGVFPLGLTVAPLVGGYVADRWGMPTVFLLSVGLYVVSSATVLLIRDTPYHTADAPWSLVSLWRRPRFRRYVIFFLAGFLAVYVGQDFVNPYLAQVHDQGFTALGVYSSLTALGTAALTLAMGRLTDLRGPRAGIGGVLVCLLAACLLLLFGTGQITWGLAALAFGSFDALRYVANAIVGPSFRGVPLAWGYAVFDTAMGLPMAVGALCGGLLYRVSAALPFTVVGVIAGGLLILLLLIGKTVDDQTAGERN
jgi:predicted MFS family arabinose efflux permease